MNTLSVDGSAETLRGILAMPRPIIVTACSRVAARLTEAEREAVADLLRIVIIVTLERSSRPTKAPDESA